jgi:hypothetical protein
MEVSQQQGERILQELEKRGDTVRNPSAYIVTAISKEPKLPQEIGCGGFGGKGACGFPGIAEGFVGKGAGGCVGMAAPRSFRGLPRHPLVNVLDGPALEALEEIGPQAASAILENLQLQGQSVHNPSAYVLRAVGNARKGKGAGAKAAGAMGAAAPKGSWPAADVRDILDARALAALEGLPAQDAQEVLARLEANSHEGPIKNPSAYVQRAVENALRRSTPENGAHLDLLGDWRHKLDERALDALQGVSAEAISHIISEMEKGNPDEIRNPSAYVIRAVGNSRKRSSNDQAFAVQSQLEGELSALMLDDKATVALQALDPMVALEIVNNMKKQAAIGNPSAYIMKAVGNAQRGDGPRLAKRPRM